MQVKVAGSAGRYIGRTSGLIGRVRRFASAGPAAGVIGLARSVNWWWDSVSEHRVGARLHARTVRTTCLSLQTAWKLELMGSSSSVSSSDPVRDHRRLTVPAIDRCRWIFAVAPFNVQ